MKHRHGTRTANAIIGALTCVLLAACGDGDEPSAAGAAQTPSIQPPRQAPSSAGAINTAPSIAGAPLTVVLAGASYSFEPSAEDPDGDPLTFVVSNPPPWASFDVSTGRLTGTPTSADVGTYDGIVISVTDGELTTSLPPFGITVTPVASGTATLSWLPPTQNTDGTPLTDLIGYRVYWGTAPDDLSSSVTLSNPGLTTYVVESLTPATWYFRVTALTARGLESAFSNLASKTIR
jgi:hypothetical protein